MRTASIHMRILSTIVCGTLIVNLFVAGCGGSKPVEPESPSDAIPTASAHGTVDRTEITQKGLSVVSAWDDGSFVKTDGSFDVVVSKVGPQLIALNSPADTTMRALALSLPGESGAPSPILFSSASTAEALLMLVPGILTTNLEEAAANLQRVRALTSFSGLVALLHAGMPNQSIGELLEQTDVQDALKACVVEWSSSGSSNSRYEPLNHESGDPWFTTTVADTRNPSAVKIILANAAWRFVAVTRCDLRADGSEARRHTVVSNSMMGGVPYSWGSVFTNSFADPTAITDAVDFSSNSGVAEADYWVRGPGLLGESDPLPSDVDGSYTDAAIKTFLVYSAFPVLDLLLGVESFLKTAKDAAKLDELVAGLKSMNEYRKVAENTVKYQSETSSLARTRLTIDISASLVKLVLSAVATKAIVVAGITVKAGVLLIAAGIVAAGMAVANIVIAVSTAIAMPETAMVSVANPVVSCQMRVVSPNGGETWLAGSQQTIQWRSFGTCQGTVTIELVRGGVPCLSIADGLPSTGSYTWTVGQCSESVADYEIRVTETSGAVDESDTAFSIPSQASPPEFLLQWGSEGNGDGQFRNPAGIAVGTGGEVYVSDFGNARIQKFTRGGAFITKWGSWGSNDGQFRFPVGIAVDAGSNVYVVDQHNDRIQKFTGDGAFLTKWGSQGSGDGQLSGAQGIAVDGIGNVYVADTNAHRIQKFTGTGAFVTKWGSQGTGDGEFLDPINIAVDTSNNVYVVDVGNNRIQKFTSGGAFITKWGSYGTSDGQFSEPTAVAVDANSNVNVGDRQNYRIQRFTSTGIFVTKWGSKGSGQGQFEYPAFIAVDANSNVYVTDGYNQRIQKFGVSTAEVFSNRTFRR